MSASGVGHLVCIVNNLNANQYITILDKLLEPSFDQLGIERKGQWFMQNGASAHRSLKATKWLADHSLNVFEWPPYSPDLNPIEHLWSILKRALYHKHPALTSRDQL